MRVSLKSVAMFVVAAAAMSGVVGYLHSQDEALAGAKHYLWKDPGVLARTGELSEFIVHKSVFYEGAPGREDPYREYRVTAKGKKSTIDVTIRATRDEARGTWSYRVQSVNQ